MIRKAVIPAAGFGTALLPATKAMPREMLPIVDQPVIGCIVEEAAESGVRDALIVVGRGNNALIDYFDVNHELELDLQQRGKSGALKQLRDLAALARIHFIRQPVQDGLGRAVALAEDHIGNEPFLVMLGDSVIRTQSRIPCSRRLIDAYHHLKGDVCVVAVEPRADDELSNFGVVSLDALPGRDDIFRITEMVEKPRAGRATSNYTLAGRYILTPDAFDALRRAPVSENGRLELTDALRLMLDAGRPFYAVPIEGKRYDIGSKLGYAKAFIELALERQDIGPELRDWLENERGNR